MQARSTATTASPTLPLLHLAVGFENCMSARNRVSHADRHAAESDTAAAPFPIPSLNLGPSPLSPLPELARWRTRARCAPDASAARRRHTSAHRCTEWSLEDFRWASAARTARASSVAVSFGTMLCCVSITTVHTRVVVVAVDGWQLHCYPL